MRLILLAELIFLSCVSIPFLSKAQVSGVVTDHNTGKPVSGVDVFINETSISTLSDQSGQFELGGIGPGFYEIILFKKGFDLYRSSMKIQTGRQYNLQLSLTANKKRKASSLTELEKSLLKNSLIGSVPSDSIEIQNITEMTLDGQRAWTSTVPLAIQNDKTGYKQYYYLAGVPFDAIAQAPVRFEPMLSQDVNQNIAREKKRKEYFNGSCRHWLMVMIADQIDAENYQIKDVNGREASSKSFITASTIPDYFKLKIETPLTIIYRDANGKERAGTVRTSGPLEVNAKGMMINSKVLELSGDMTKSFPIDQLPNDYEPIAGDVEAVYTQTIQRFCEKVYVHTDKPYYYPGELLWFKGYINYREPLWRDSLSKVMYVELIDPKNEIMLTKTLKIDSGFFQNDFILPDSLMDGTYYLRAYTNLNRNFGDSSLFTKPIPILNRTDKVVHTQGRIEEEISSELSITTDKQIYKPREKITLNVQTKNEEGQSVASNLSVSVTDAIQVVPVKDQNTILNAYQFEGKQNTMHELKYPVEFGVAYTGKFLNDKGKPEKTLLNIFQLNPRRMMFAVSDEQGLFSQSGLDFYDTVTFSFKAEKAKEYPYGKVYLVARETPPMPFQVRPHKIEVENTQSPQRILSAYEVPKYAKILQEVTIKATRIDDKPRRSLGYADLVIKEKDINQTNVLYTLMHIPGVVVDMMYNRIVFTRAANQSITFSRGPLVVIDGLPMYDQDAGQILSTLNPANIESIEVTKRLVTLYGGMGGNGIIEVYTKQGPTGEPPEVTPNFQLLTIRGYSPERKFRYPDYDDIQTDTTHADYRSTIYWNPEVKTNAKNDPTSVSFFAADLPGKYRIVAEGVLENGEPVRSVVFITIESN